MALVVKNLLANARDIRDPGSIPGFGRSPGGGHGNPLQYSCLENPTDRGAWHATVHGIARSQTSLKQFITHHIPVNMDKSYNTDQEKKAERIHMIFFHLLKVHKQENEMIFCLGR